MLEGKRNQGSIAPIPRTNEEPHESLNPKLFRLGPALWFLVLGLPGPKALNRVDLKLQAV